MKLEGFGTPTDLPELPIKASGKTDGQTDEFGSLLSGLREPVEVDEQVAKPQAARARDDGDEVDKVNADEAQPVGDEEVVADTPVDDDEQAADVGPTNVEGQREPSTKPQTDDGDDADPPAQPKPATPVVVDEVKPSEEPDADDTPKPPAADPLQHLDAERPELQTPEPTQAEQVVAELKAVAPVAAVPAPVEAPAPVPVTPAPSASATDKPQPAPTNQPTVDADAVVVKPDAKGGEPSSNQSGQSDRRSEQQGQQRGAAAEQAPKQAAPEVEVVRDAKPQAATPSPSVAEQQAQQTPVARADASTHVSAPATPAPTPGVAVELAAPATAIDATPSKPAPAPSASATQGGAQAAPQAELPEADAQRITDRVVKGLRSVINQRGGTLTLRLNPAELGAMRISVKMDGTAVAAQFQASTAAASQALNQNLAALRHALEAQGLTVENLNVQVTSSSSSSGSSQSQTEQHTDGSPTDGQSKGLMRDGDQAHGGRGDGREDQPEHHDFKQELLDLVV